MTGNAFILEVGDATVFRFRDSAGQQVIACQDEFVWLTRTYEAGWPGVGAQEFNTLAQLFKTCRPQPGSVERLEVLQR